MDEPTNIISTRHVSSFGVIHASLPQEQLLPAASFCRLLLGRAEINIKLCSTRMTNVEYCIHILSVEAYIEERDSNGIAYRKKN